MKQKGTALFPISMFATSIGLGYLAGKFLLNSVLEGIILGVVVGIPLFCWLSTFTAFRILISILFGTVEGAFVGYFVSEFVHGIVAPKQPMTEMWCLVFMAVFAFVMIFANYSSATTNPIVLSEMFDKKLKKEEKEYNKIKKINDEYRKELRKEEDRAAKEAAKNPGAASEQPAQEPVRVEEPIDYSKIKRLSPDEYEEISKEICKIKAHPEWVCFLCIKYSEFLKWDLRPVKRKCISSVVLSESIFFIRVSSFRTTTDVLTPLSLIKPFVI